MSENKIDKPLFVIKYGGLKRFLMLVVGLVSVFLILYVVFGEGILEGFLREVLSLKLEELSPFTRLVVEFSLRAFFLLVGLVILWYVVGILNSRGIEVYRDRIVERMRWNFLLWRDRTVRFENALCTVLEWGYYLRGIPVRTHLLILRDGRGSVRLDLTMLKGEDKERFAEFFSSLSGKDKELFLGTGSFKEETFKIQASPRE